jgi:hypothetical protein
MPPIPADIWYRIHETPQQLAALVEARKRFNNSAEFANAFWSASEAEINEAHEVEAGFTTVQNYAAEVARWSAITGGWRTPNATGTVPFSSRRDYEALRNNAVISSARFGAIWSLQIERNRLTHERPEVDPRKVWAASSRVAKEVPALFLDVIAWLPQVGFTL